MKHLLLAGLFVVAFTCPAFAELHIQDFGGYGPVEDENGMLVGEYSSNQAENGVIYHNKYGMGTLSNSGDSGSVSFPNGESDTFVKHDVKAESEKDNNE